MCFSVRVGLEPTVKIFVRSVSNRDRLHAYALSTFCPLFMAYVFRFAITCSPTDHLTSISIRIPCTRPRTVALYVASNRSHNRDRVRFATREN